MIKGRSLQCEFWPQNSQILICQGPLNGGVSNGGVSRSGLVLPFLSFFCPFFGPFWDFPDFSGIFPICSGTVRGISRFVPFLFLGLLRAPTRNSPERVRDTIWTFPEKSGQPLGLETPGLASLKFEICCGFLGGLHPPGFFKEKGPKKSAKKSPRNSGLCSENFSLGFLQKPFLALKNSPCLKKRGIKRFLRSNGI